MRGISLIIIITAAYTFSVSGQVTFQKTFDGYFNPYGRGCCVATFDGGCIIAGISSDFGNATQIYAVRLDSSGSIKWSRNFGCTLYDNIVSILGTDDDGFVCCGETMKNGEHDIFIFRFDSNGDTVWTKTLNHNGWEKVIDFGKDADSNYVIFGSASFQYQFLLIKLDQIGNVLWSKCISIPGAFNNHSIEVAADGSIILTVNVSDPYPSVAIIKISESGSIKWAKRYGNQTISFHSYSMTITSDGGCVLSGYYDDIASLAILRVDQNGNLIWTKGFYGQDNDELFSMTQTSDGNFIATGYHDNPIDRNILVFHFNQSGNIIFNSIIGRLNYEETGFSIVESKENGYFICGLEADTNLKMYVAKINENGTTVCGDWSTNLSDFGTLPLQEDSFQISISDIPLVQTDIPIIVSTGGSDHTICTSIGIPELGNALQLQISPNPSNGIFHISFLERNPYEKLSIYNSFGEIILKDEIGGEELLDVDLSSQAKGIYFVRLESGDQYQVTRICLTN